MRMRIGGLQKVTLLDYPGFGPAGPRDRQPFH